VKEEIVIQLCWRGRRRVPWNYWLTLRG